MAEEIPAGGILVCVSHSEGDSEPGASVVARAPEGGQSAAGSGFKVEARYCSIELIGDALGHPNPSKAPPSHPSLVSILHALCT